MGGPFRPPSDLLRASTDSQFPNSRTGAVRATPAVSRRSATPGWGTLLGGVAQVLGQHWEKYG